MTKIDINWLSDDSKYQYTIDCMQLEIDRLKERYDNLKKEHRDTITRNEDYRARIDKAIEYIKEYGNLYCLKHKQFKDYHQYKVLLDILQGEKNE